jgi:predicted phage-related endonuclease
VSQDVVPRNYWLQVQHQLMVSGAERAELYVYNHESQSGIALEILPEPEAFEKIRTAWDGFMAHIEADTPPDLTDRDKQVRDDTDWVDAAANYKQCKAALDDAKSRLDAAKTALVALANHPSVTGAGVTVTRFFKKGAVDYRRAVSENGLDVEGYRKPGSTDVRVTVGS